MEIDKGEDDWELIHRLNTMGTRDKEELQAQFQSIVGTQMSPGCSKFYLEMGNWNLQTALCAYYDLLASTDRVPSMELVEESYHTEDCSVKPSEAFTKFWKLKNTGNEPWPANLKLKFVKGQNFSHGETVVLTPAEPQQTIELRINMIAPNQDGLYQGQWRGVTLNGVYFGNSLVVAVNVDSSNISGLTAQMHKLGQYNENRHINHEDMSNDSDLICTQQIPSPIILPTITTHSLSQSSYLLPPSNLGHLESQSINGALSSRPQQYNSNSVQMNFSDQFDDQNITDS